MFAGSVGIAVRRVGEHRARDIDDLVVAVAGHDQAGRDRTPLTGVRDRRVRAEQRRHRQVAVVEEHERGLAAELEEHPLHGGARRRHDLAPDRRRAGERHDVDVGMRRQLGADLGIGGREHVDDARRDLGRLGDELAERERRPRRVGRALEHHRAPGGERGRELRERELDRVVVRRDRADDAGGLLLDPPVVPARERVALAEVLDEVVALEQIRVPAHDVGRARELRTARARDRRADLAPRGSRAAARRCRAAPGAAGAGTAPGSSWSRDHSVVSNARRAAAIARCASATVASAATPRTASVAGLTVSKVAPPVAGTSSPSISSRSSCQVVTPSRSPRAIVPTGRTGTVHGSRYGHYARRELLSRQEHAGFSTEPAAESDGDRGTDGAAGGRAVDRRLPLGAPRVARRARRRARAPLRPRPGPSTSRSRRCNG